MPENITQYDIFVSVMVTYHSDKEPDHFSFNAKGCRQQIISDLCCILCYYSEHIKKISICSNDRGFNLYNGDLGAAVLVKLRSMCIPEKLRNWIRSHDTKCIWNWSDRKDVKRKLSLAICESDCLNLDELVDLFVDNNNNNNNGNK